MTTLFEAYEEAGPIATTGHANDPEARLQGWADRMFDRIVMPPCYITALPLEARKTQNERAREAGRGTKFGTPDHLVIQGEPIVIAMPEFKIWPNQPTDRQNARMRQINATGGRAAPCWNLKDALDLLRRAGIRLHGNADNICRELTERWLADEEGRALAKPKKPAKPRAPRPTKRGVQIAAAWQRR